MTEISNPDKKIVFVGDKDIPEAFDINLQQLNFEGVRILTDSTELYGNLHATKGFRGPETEHLASFRYLTKNPVPFTGFDNRPIRGLEKEYAGEIYSDVNLADFYFQGPEKFGTLISMAYGIRALKTIDVGKLGLHSSLIVDNENGAGTLIVARNRNGKSFIGQAVENTDKRFWLASDDWNEVDLSTTTVRPVSSVFAPSEVDGVYVPRFDSFGKRFYTRQPKDDQIIRPLRRIIELESCPEDRDTEKFILKSLGHIPFFGQPTSHGMFLDTGKAQEIARNRIRRATDAILFGYLLLRETVETIRISNIHNVDQRDDVINQVREAIH